MHQLFASKDEVLAASLERRLPVYEARTASAAQGAGTPRERILRVFERLEQASIEPAYRGCPYLAALVELKIRTTRRAWSPVSRPWRGRPR